MEEELQSVININTFDEEAALKRFKEDPLGELKKIGVSVRPGSEAANYIMAQRANLDPTILRATCVIVHKD